MTAPVIVEPPRTSMEKGTPRRTLTITQDHHEPRETARADPLVRARSASPSLADPTAKGLEGSASSDIGTVVSKAKRAASSLWILIHAQNCRIGGSNCPHQGCIEAKKVLLHLKTCPAVNGCECPERFNGCHQARKLLAHHKRCRELRAKQAGMRRGPQPQQHVCLVCSLVARHARNLLEGKTRAAWGPNTRKQAIASFTLKQTGPDSTLMVPRGLNSGLSMPPPPPRPSATRSSSTSPVPTFGHRRQMHSIDNRCSSPPPESQLHQFSVVAAAAATPNDIPPHPSALGKSLDSSKSSFLTFAAGMLQKMKESPADGRRSRAESLDMSSASRFHKSRYSDTVSNPGNDPTLEFELKRSSREEIGEEKIIRRPRSASLGVLVDCAIQRACPPIEEEGHEVRESDEHPFFMEEEDEG